jgi:hypothetical protein
VTDSVQDKRGALDDHFRFAFKAHLGQQGLGDNNPCELPIFRMVVFMSFSVSTILLRSGGAQPSGPHHYIVATHYQKRTREQFTKW